MSLPFDTPRGYLPVIVPRPKIRKIKQADGNVQYEPFNGTFLPFKSDRDLFDIGTMLDIEQFAALTAAEKYTLLALKRRLKFNDKILFPDLRETGKLYSVENSDEKLVWCLIPDSVIVTTKFTPMDLSEQDMALDDPKTIREIIEQALVACPEADVEALRKRFFTFKMPHVSDIRRALASLVRLGMVKEYIRENRHERRAVFNMRLVAATRSGILSGMVAANDHLRRIHGSVVSFSRNPATEPEPIRLEGTTSKARRKKLTRADYQTRYHQEKARREKAEKLITELEANPTIRMVKHKNQD